MRPHPWETFLIGDPAAGGNRQGLPTGAPTPVAPRPPRARRAPHPRGSRLPVVSHGLVTLFKYRSRVPWREAVTVLRDIAIVVCVLLPLGLGSVAAAPTSFGHELEDRRVGAGFERVEYGSPFVEESCVGTYRLVCVGPVKPQEVEAPVGATAVGFAENDTFAVVVVDQERVQPYGPYIVDVPGADEDVRVCYFGCLVPYPVFAQAHANWTLDVWAADAHLLHREGNSTLTLGGAGALPLPPAFGCDPHQRQCDG